jgi:opacity protein-like surface antigen
MVQSLFKKSILVGASVFTFNAFAGEGYFGWVYGLDLQPEGKLEFEQRLQLTRGQETGSYDLWQGRTELEYGLTNDIQIAGYLNSYSIQANKNYTNENICDQGVTPCTGGYGVSGLDNPGDPYAKTGIDGVSLEGIWRITNPVTSPIGVGLYLEPTIGKLKNALESRLIVQSNFLDDRLQLVGNLVYEVEQLKFDVEPIEETVLDVVGGITYRVMPNLNVGLEYRFHNDFDGYSFSRQTQRAHFWGPNIHYATKDWWVTAAMRTQVGGTCWDPGTAECSNGKVWDSHGKNEYIVKFGMPF